MRKSILLLSIVGVFGSAIPSQVHAAISNEVERKSVQLIESGKSTAAYNLLNSQPKTTPQDWFLFGMAAHKAGKLQKAEQAYLEVLRLDPSSRRAKLELASVLAARKNWSEARRLLQEVKATNPPAQVAQNIDRFLSVLNEREGEDSNWRVRASTAVIYDSNVNNGPSIDVVRLFGLPFTLSEDAKAQSDTAYTFRFEADHIARIHNTLNWQSNVSLNWTDYSTLDQYDSLQVSASTGPVFQIDPDTIFSVPVSADFVVYTDEGRVFSNSIGIAPQFRRKLNDDVTFNFNTSLSHKHFDDNGERDTTSYSISPGFDFATECGSETLRLSTNFGNDNSGVGIYSNDNWGLNASIFCSLGENTAMTLFGGYKQSDYEEREAAHPVVREDITRSIGFNIQHAHKSSGIDFVASGTFTDNDSNLPIYTYDRFQGTLSARKKF